jgi:DNA-binding MarR family transcriptional regulator
LASTTEVDLANQLRIVMGKLSRRLRESDAATGTGLTPARISALLNVDRNGPIRLSGLAESEGLNPTMLSRMVADFVQQGIFHREWDDADRRAAWVRCTDEGHALAVSLRGHRTEVVESALAGLPDADRRRIENAVPSLLKLAEQLRDVRA